MKIMLFTHEPISHIKPLEKMLKELINKAEVYCYCYERNYDFFHKLGVEAYIYPNEMMKSKTEKYLEINKQEMDIALKNKDYLKFYEHYLIEDIISIHRLNFKSVLECKNNVESICPDVILRDSVDQVGKIISKELKIKTVGYITNPLYNFTLFETDPFYYYGYFMNLFTNLLNDEDYDDFSRNFLLNMKSYLFNLYKKTERKYNLYELYPYHHYDPNEDKNIIFTIPQFQSPKSFEIGKQYVIIPPNVELFYKEKNISQKLIDFIKRSKPLCYISTGSFVNIPMEKYIEIIEALIDENYKIIISCKEMLGKIKEYINLKNFKDSIFLSNYLPQNYVLEKSELFITIGGMNSINEAIFNEVPIIVCPITAEQVFNGLTVQKLKVGETTYSREMLKSKKTLRQIIHETSNSEVIKYNLHKLKDEMVKENDNSIKNAIKMIMEAGDEIWS